MAELSRRLLNIVNALPLYPGIRILEIGCGSGAAAREVAKRVGDGRVLGIDRSEKAISGAMRTSGDQIALGVLEYRLSAIEDFELKPDEEPYDIAFAVRVGAFDGRHPELEEPSLARVRAALKPGGELYLDGGTPLRRGSLQVSSPRPR